MSASQQSLEPDYTIVRSVHLETEDPGGECTLAIHLSRDIEPTSPAVTVRFTGVSNLTLSEFGGGYSQICGLAVEDISGNQLDRLNWRVTDLEHERIEFMCQHYEVAR
jgi:hypothetical protein